MRAPPNIRIEIVNIASKEDKQALHWWLLCHYNAHPSADGSYTLCCDEVRIAQFVKQIEGALSSSTRIRICQIDQPSPSSLIMLPSTLQEPVQSPNKNVAFF
jgi:hypothetical protein